MAATFRASTVASSGATPVQVITCNKPAGVANADVLIAALAVNGGTDVRVMRPSGWALIRTITNGTALALFIFAKQGAAADPASWNWILDSPRNVVVEVRAYYNNTGGSFIRLAVEGGQATPSAT